MTHIPQKNLHPLVRYQNYMKACDQNQTKFSHCVTTGTLKFYTFLLPPPSGQNFLLKCGYRYRYLPTNYMAKHHRRTYLDTNYHEKLKPAPSLMMEAAWSSETTVVHCYQQTWCHTPEDTECHDNLKPSTFCKTKVTACITNVVKKFCARHTLTLWRIRLVLSSELHGFFEEVVYARIIPRCHWESGILGCDTVNGGAVPSIIKHYIARPAKC